MKLHSDVDWRFNVEACDGPCYIYSADLYCKDCGEAIKQATDRDIATGEVSADCKESGNSDHYPQPISGKDELESDTVEHCGCGASCVNVITLPNGNKIGAWLGNTLTRDGQKELLQKVQDPGLEGSHSYLVASLWAYLYDLDDKFQMTRKEVLKELDLESDTSNYDIQKHIEELRNAKGDFGCVIEDLGGIDEVTQWALLARELDLEAAQVANLGALLEHLGFSPNRLSRVLSCPDVAKGIKDY
jgi:hypothetical protein